jgi:hypothetical protein
MARSATTLTRTMKRITFKSDFVDAILCGTKRQTCRWRYPKLQSGDVVAAVTASNGRPAFLVPASDRFATLRILSCEPVFWEDFTDEQAAESGVTRDWYLRENPTASSHQRLWVIKFEIEP